MLLEARLRTLDKDQVESVQFIQVYTIYYRLCLLIYFFHHVHVILHLSDTNSDMITMINGRNLQALIELQSRSLFAVRTSLGVRTVKVSLVSFL